MPIELSSVVPDAPRDEVAPGASPGELSAAVAPDAPPSETGSAAPPDSRSVTPAPSTASTAASPVETASGSKPASGSPSLPPTASALAPSSSPSEPLASPADTTAAAATATTAAAAAPTPSGSPPPALAQLQLFPSEVPPTPSATHPAAAAAAQRQGRFVSHTGAGSCGAGGYLQGELRCDDAPPYFIPTNCVARAFTPEHAGACLNGSTIFMIGNSVQRQYMYELGTLLNGYRAGRDYQYGGGADEANAERVRQKLACAKAPRSDQDSHAQSCQVDYAPVTSVRYMWRQWFGEPFAYADTAAEGDFCYGADPEECVRAFLSDAQPGDLLMFQLGLAYARYLKAELTPIDAYIRAEAQAFVGMVRRVWKGGVVLAVNVSPMQLTASGTGWPPGTNTRAVAVNDAEMAVYREAGWPVVDQWSMNQGQTETMYGDPAHFPSFTYEDERGKKHFACLSQAMWQHALSLVCPFDLGAWPAGYTPPAVARAAGSAAARGR